MSGLVPALILDNLRLLKKNLKTFSASFSLSFLSGIPTICMLEHLIPRVAEIF